MRILSLITLWGITGALQSPVSAQDTPAPPAHGRTIEVKGSDTMVRLAAELAEAFHKTGGTVVNVAGGGSGAGIAALNAGSAAIATSTRRMKPAEKAAIEKDGRMVSEFVPGYDALGICVHPDCPLAALSMDQLRGIWITGEIRNWDAVGVKNHSGAIDLFGFPNTSGEYSFLLETLGGSIPQGFAAGVTEAKTEALLLQRVSSGTHAMGFARPGKTDGTVKVVPVAPKSGAPPVAPTPQTIADGTYPLSRPLYFYTTNPGEPGILEFIACVKSDAGQKIVTGRGFTALPAGKAGGKKGSAEK